MSRRSAMAAHWLAQGPAARDDRGGALRKNAAIAPLPGTSSTLPTTAPITGRLQDLSLYSVRVGVQDRCRPGLTPSSCVLAGGGRDHKPSRGRCRSTTEGILRFSSWDRSTTTTAEASSPFQVGAMRELAYNKNNHDDTMSRRTKALVTTRIQSDSRANIALQLIGTPACTLVPRLATRRANS